MAKKKLSQESGIMLISSFFVLFAVNIGVVYFANAFFPLSIVLGTAHITKVWALIHSMGTLTILNAFLITLIKEIEVAHGKTLTDKQWMIKYLIINFAGLWIIGRFANQLGIGFTSWRVVLFLAIALDIAQGIAMKWLNKTKN